MYSYRSTWAFLDWELPRFWRSVHSEAGPLVRGTEISCGKKVENDRVRHRVLRNSEHPTSSSLPPSRTWKMSKSPAYFFTVSCTLLTKQDVQWHTRRNNSSDIHLEWQGKRQILAVTLDLHLVEGVIRILQPSERIASSFSLNFV